MACPPVPVHLENYLIAAVCCVLAVALPGTAHSQQQWDSYGGSPGGGHFSPLAQITPANVAGLELVEMQETDTCCGFGGTFAVKFGDISAAIAERKCVNLQAAAADAAWAAENKWQTKRILDYLEGRIK